MTRHTITPAERGHRSPLTPGQQSAVYTSRLPAALRDSLRKKTARVRALLNDFALEDQADIRRVPVRGGA